MNRHDHNGQSHEHRADAFRGLQAESSCGPDWETIEEGVSGVRSGDEDRDTVVMAFMRSMFLAIEDGGPANAHYEATCHRLAFGIRIDDNESMRSVAEKRGLSVEAVSKKVKAIRDRYRLPLNSFNKPAAVAEGYKETNRTRRKV